MAADSPHTELSRAARRKRFRSPPSISALPSQISPPSSTLHSYDSRSDPSMLAVQQNLASTAEIMYGRRSAEGHYRPQPIRELIELPPLRQAVPEIMDTNPSPTNDLRDPPAYSPMNKRRRLSEEEGDLGRGTQGRSSNFPSTSPRHAPRYGPGYGFVSSPDDTRAGQFSAPESRRVSEPNTPFPSQHATSMPSQSPSTFEFPTAGPRLQTLPSLSAMNLQQSRAPEYPDPRDVRAPEYSLESSRPLGLQQQVQAPYYAQPQHKPYVPPQYGYQQPRAVSVSGPYYPQYQGNYSSPHYYNGNNYVSGFAMADSNHDPQRQRKRRGNLPKQTTDILRGWFNEHVIHPYPTEDEKQELMRQTSLQMSK